jgi:hypothetical protein
MTNHYQGSTHWIAAVDESEARQKAEQLIKGEHFELVQVGIFQFLFFQNSIIKSNLCLWNSDIQP